MSIHGLFIGIDLYMDGRISNLQCAVRDAESMGSMFESIGAKPVLLLNSRATALSIRRGVSALARKVNYDDTAIIYFAGHGAKETLPLRSSEQRVVPFLVPYDAVRDDLVATAIPMDEVGRFLEMIPCRNVLFFFDSCYSGAATYARTFVLPGTRQAEKGAPVFPEISGKGTVILAASQEYEPSYEDPAVGHGVFTEYLIEALSGGAPASDDGSISLPSVFAHLQEKVPEKTKRLFNQKQSPIQHGTIVENVTFPIIRESPNRTLAGFPYMFLPLTIIVGDRREQEPKTPGDLFALSASPAELRWVLGLGLPPDTEIVSDKVFRNANKEYLLKNFGARNLLVVGSPAANHVARIANETAFFSFDVDPAVHSQMKTISDDIDKIGSDRGELVNYALDPRFREGFRFYMNQYRKGGFIDPLYKFIRRGDTIPHDKDYGVVSICRNPYAPRSSGEFVCILAAGVHLPATMHAVSLLARADDELKDRPLGGIFSVLLTETDWEKRMAFAKPNWSTESYGLLDMRSALFHLKENLDYLKGLTEASIDDRLSLLAQLIGS